MIALYTVFAQKLDTYTWGKCHVEMITEIEFQSTALLTIAMPHQENTNVRVYLCMETPICSGNALVAGLKP